MSLKLKELREKKNITKTELSKKTNTNYRTITNWEMENGTTPSLDVMRTIADALGVDLNEIYHCFMVYPDITNPADLPVSSPTPDILDYEETIDPLLFDYVFPLYYYPQKGQNLFNLLKSCRLECPGLLRYKDFYFYFSQIFVCDKTEVFDTKKDDYHLGNPSEFGIILADCNMNFIVIVEKDIVKWWIEDISCCGNLVIKFYSSLQLFDENKREVSLGRDFFSLILFDYKSVPKGEYKPIEFAKEDKKNILSTYIRKFRENKGITQERFAEEFNNVARKRKENRSKKYVDNTTINKWEKNTLNPTPFQIDILCEYCKIPQDIFLYLVGKGYYVSRIKKGSYVYRVGFNLLFDKATSIAGFNTFLYYFRVLKKTIIKSNTLWGFFSDNNTYSSFVYSFYKADLRDNTLYLRSEDGKYIILTIRKIIPQPIKLNNIYEFKLITQNEDKLFHSQIAFILYEGKRKV